MYYLSVPSYWEEAKVAGARLYAIQINPTAAAAVIRRVRGGSSPYQTDRRPVGRDRTPRRPPPPPQGQ